MLPYNNDTLVHLDRDHFEEWQKSGVGIEIITLNVQTIHDSNKVDEILNRNTKSRWKSSKELVPCWAVTGLDPTGWERTLEGAQIKPNVPPTDKKGRAQKYLGAYGYNVAPLFLDPGIPDYWTLIMADKTQPVIITEGAKKAAAGLTAGLPTISIPGVATCRKNGRLHNWLNLFAGFGRTFYLCFDNDIMHKLPVQNALIGLSRELAATGSKVMIIELPSGPLKGMDDYIASEGSDSFKAIMRQAKTVEEWLEVAHSEFPQDIDSDSRICRNFKVIKSGWGSRLRYNQLKHSIELDGEFLNINQIRIRVGLEFGVDIPIGDCQVIIEMVAENNSFNPVVEYLDGLSGTRDTSIIDDLATRYFRTNEPIYDVYLKKLLIASVARARQPGCKHDIAVILAGEQGYYKSSFWRLLYGEEWFTDGLGSCGDKDELLKLHNFWCCEWSEFESVYRRKDISSLKDFMSRSIDPLRVPYGRQIEKFKRQCVLVGTTNELEILNDPTGDRRFWVIPVQSEIPIFNLEKERDRIWAAADFLYKQGHHWWLTPDEELQRQNLNSEFHSQDPWTEAIIDFLSHREITTTREIFTHLGIEPAKQDKALAKRISEVMRRQGWRNERKRFDGKMVYHWTPKISSIQKNIKLSFQPDPDRSPEENGINQDMFFTPDLSGSAGIPNFIKKENDPENRYPATQTLDISKTVELLPQKTNDFVNIVDTEHIEYFFETKKEPKNDAEDFPIFDLGKHDYKFWLISPLPFRLRFPTILGNVIATVMPIKAIRNRAHVCIGYLCELKVNFPDGTIQQTEITIEADNSAKEFENPLKIKIQDWEQRKWPEIGMYAMYGGEKVKIVGFSHGGKKFQIEFESGKLQPDVSIKSLKRCN